MRAPPRRVLSPTRHRPPVERTTESAMARPRPCPPTLFVPRRKRSKSRARFLLSNPGTGVLDSEEDTLAAPCDLDPDTTARPAYLQALSTKTAARRSIHSAGAVIRVSPAPR